MCVLETPNQSGVPKLLFCICLFLMWMFVSLHFVWVTLGVWLPVIEVCVCVLPFELFRGNVYVICLCVKGAPIIDWTPSCMLGIGQWEPELLFWWGCMCVPCDFIFLFPEEMRHTYMNIFYVFSMIYLTLHLVVLCVCVCAFVFLYVCMCVYIQNMILFHWDVIAMYCWMCCAAFKVSACVRVIHFLCKTLHISYKFIVITLWMPSLI